MIDYEAASLRERFEGGRAAMKAIADSLTPEEIKKAFDAFAEHNRKYFAKVSAPTEGRGSG